MRPKPITIMEQKIAGKPGKVRVIMETAAVYAVVYCGRPFNYMDRDDVTPAGHRYYRTSFATPGQALLLARKLNYYFDTEDFSVLAYTDDGSIPVVEM